jgi:gluconokinase
MIILVMGVTGSGKTTEAVLLAHRLGSEFADADDFHSAENKAKMHRGIPLSDADRLPWLQTMHMYLLKAVTERRNVILACSALKESYRHLLLDGIDARVVYLKGSYELIRRRLESRKGHFADEHILAAQFADLEEPTPAEAIIVDINAAPEVVVSEILLRLNL